MVSIVCFSCFVLFYCAERPAVRAFQVSILMRSLICIE